MWHYICFVFIQMLVYMENRQQGKIFNSFVKMCRPNFKCDIFETQKWEKMLNSHVKFHIPMFCFQHMWLTSTFLQFTFEERVKCSYIHDCKCFDVEMCIHRWEKPIKCPILFQYHIENVSLDLKLISRVKIFKIGKHKYRICDYFFMCIQSNKIPKCLCI